MKTEPQDASFVTGKTFADVPAGEAFNHANTIYLKLQYPVRAIKEVGETIYRAIKLINGQPCCFTGKEYVRDIGNYAITRCRGEN